MSEKRSIDALNDGSETRVAKKRRRKRNPDLTKKLCAVCAKMRYGRCIKNPQPVGGIEWQKFFHTNKTTSVCNACHIAVRKSATEDHPIVLAFSRHNADARFGLYAQKNFAAGEKITEYGGRLLPLYKLQNSDAISTTYCVRIVGTPMVIDGASDYRSSERSGLGRFIIAVKPQPGAQHEDSINCKMISDSGRLCIDIVATRNVACGQELLIEHRQDLLVGEQADSRIRLYGPATINTVRSSWQMPPRLYSGLAEPRSGQSASPTTAVSIWNSKPAAWKEPMASNPQQVRLWQKRALETRVMRHYLAKDTKLTVGEQKKCQKLLRQMIEN